MMNATTMMLISPATSPASSPARPRALAALATAALAGCALAGCALGAPSPEADQAQAQVAWAGSTQPSLKGAYWLRLDDNYGTVSINDDRRVAWNLETPGFGGFDGAGVAALYASYRIQTLVRIGDAARPSAADAAALAGATFGCGQLSAAWFTALDNEAAITAPAIVAQPASIAGFLFGNEPNIGPPIAGSGWGISGTAYGRAYNCYRQHWAQTARASYPLFVAGPGGCNGGFNCAGFYTGMLAALAPPIDGYTIHAYGSSTFVHGQDAQGFADQVALINQKQNGAPVYITEFNAGGNAPPTAGGGDYLNQRYADVRTFNQGARGQIKALIYFVDALLGIRSGSCASATTDPWFALSLCQPATRALWLAAGAAQVTAPAQANQADLVEGLSTVPGFQMPGQLSAVSILARNPGLSTWPGTGVSSAYRLGANAGNAFLFSSVLQCGGYGNNVLDGRIYTCATVAPGGAFTYQVNARAPTTGTGTATLSVRMVQDGAQWFGYGAQFPIGLGQASCGSAVTQCVLFQRPDVLSFYAANGWNTSCANRDAIVANWCSSGDVAACNALKAGACAAFNSACRCSGGAHVDGVAIDPAATFCGYQVCGRDHKVYACQAGGWQNTLAACN